MVGQDRSTRKVGKQEESVEYRRHRMRIAQRKHRARKEQTIASLEEEVQACHTRLAQIESAFKNLEQVVQKATRNGSYTSRIDLWPALDTLREALDEASPQHQDAGQTSQCNEDPGIWTKPKEPLPDLPGPFAIHLYEQCITLAFRLLSSKDGPSNRLASRLFRHYMLQMEPQDPKTRMRILRECLGARAHFLAHTHDPKLRRNMWKILTKPRVPGCTEHLNVAEAETYLRNRGFEFSEDLTQAFIRIEHDELFEAPDLESDSDDSEDMSDDHSFPMWDSSPNLFGIPAYSKRPSFADPNTAAAADESLPFGLHDQGANDDDSIEIPGFGLPQNSNISPVADLFDPDAMDVFSTTSCPNHPSETYQQPRKTTVIQVNMSELVRRLVSISVCIGTPGPGFVPGEVEKIVEDLIACK